MCIQLIGTLRRELVAINRFVWVRVFSIKGSHCQLWVVKRFVSCGTECESTHPLRDMNKRREAEDDGERVSP